MLTIVTGATGGLGYETALGLATAGHEVIVAARNPAKGADAVARLRAAVPAAQVEFALLDLASLASVEAFAAAVPGPVGLLVNNAGVMAPDRRQVTPDGFELQMGTNYFGHYALTARLLPRLIEGQARVVQVSSLAHRSARIAFDDLQGARRYRPWVQYGQSKLAMLMLALELDRRARAAHWPILSMAAHPGWAVTDIIANGPGGGSGTGLRERAMQGAFRLFGQSAAAGARPILHAGLAINMRGGTYWGPTGIGEIRGAPGPARIMPQASDTVAGARLWDVSAELVGAQFYLDRLTPSSRA